MLNSPWNDSKLSLLQYLKSLRINIKLTYLSNFFSLDYLLQRIDLKAISEYCVGLSWTSLAISENRWIETVKNTVKAILNGIEDLSLSCFLIKYFGIRWFQIATTIRNFDDTGIKLICKNNLGFSNFCSHKRPDPHKYLDFFIGWTLLLHQLTWSYIWELAFISQYGLATDEWLIWDQA